MGDDALEPPPNDARFVADVIDLGEMRVQWGRAKPSREERCQHNSLIYSGEERRVWCEKCERSIDNFDAFMVLVHNFQKMVADARHKIAKADDAMKATIHRRATKEVDRMWSGNVMAIGCPHCQRGILPEDWADGAATMLGRDYELALRNRKKEPTQ